MICPWALKDEFLKTYHDEEWCRPHHDDTYLFEMLVLEGAQAGAFLVYDFETAGRIQKNIFPF